MRTISKRIVALTAAGSLLMIAPAMTPANAATQPSHPGLSGHALDPSYGSISAGAFHFLPNPTRLPSKRTT